MNSGRGRDRRGRHAGLQGSACGFLQRSGEMCPPREWKNMARKKLKIMDAAATNFISGPRGGREECIELYKDSDHRNF